MSRTIIVSDLHIDTWTDRKIGKTGKTRLQLFIDFLAWCKGADIARFIINGDLMDFPPYSGFAAFGPNPSIARDAIERLLAFGAGKPLVYIFGNHDIGLSGYRNIGANSIAPLKNVDFSYPDYVLKYPGSTILLEHGHFYDVFLNLYRSDLDKRTYDEGYFDKVRWGTPDGPAPAPPPTTPPPGRLPAVSVPEGQSLYSAVVASEPKEQPSTPSVDGLVEGLGNNKVVREVVMWTWRRSASSQMKKYIAHLASQGKKPTPVIYQVFGHTHCADVRKENINGVECDYFNSGTWTGGSDSCNYLDVDKNGKIWLHDWAADSTEARRLNTA